MTTRSPAPAAARHTSAGSTAETTPSRSGIAVPSPSSGPRRLSRAQAHHIHAPDRRFHNSLPYLSELIACWLSLAPPWRRGCPTWWIARPHQAARQPHECHNHGVSSPPANPMNATTTGSVAARQPHERHNHGVRCPWMSHSSGSGREAGPGLGPGGASAGREPGAGTGAGTRGGNPGRGPGGRRRGCSPVPGAGQRDAAATAAAIRRTASCIRAGDVPMFSRAWPVP